MDMMVGTPEFYGGTTGTVTINAGEVIKFVSGFAVVNNATVQILGRQATTLPNGGQWFVWFDHNLCRAESTQNTIVFTNTSHYFVHTVKPGGTVTGGGSQL